MLKAVIYICCDTKFEDHKTTVACHFDNFCKSLGKFWMRFSVVFVTISRARVRYYQSDPGPYVLSMYLCSMYRNPCLHWISPKVLNWKFSMTIYKLYVLLYNCDLCRQQLAKYNDMDYITNGAIIYQSYMAPMAIL